MAARSCSCVLARNDDWSNSFLAGTLVKLPSGYLTIAMENGPFIDDFPIKTSIYKGFSMAMLNNQMVSNNKCGIYMMLRTCIELKNPSPANLRDMPCGNQPCLVGKSPLFTQEIIHQNM